MKRDLSTRMRALCVFVIVATTSGCAPLYPLLEPEPEVPVRNVDKQVAVTFAAEMAECAAYFDLFGDILEASGDPRGAADSREAASILLDRAAYVVAADDAYIHYGRALVRKRALAGAGADATRSVLHDHAGWCQEVMDYGHHRLKYLYNRVLAEDRPYWPNDPIQ